MQEAIDFVSRIKPAPGSGKTEDLVFIGNVLLQNGNGREDRDRLLGKVIEGLLRLGDIENPSRFLGALSDSAAAQKFSRTMEDAMRLRQSSLVDNGS